MKKNKTKRFAKREIIPIFFATDDNYVPLLHVAIQSIVSQASNAYNYHINILCDNVSSQNKKELKTYKRKNVKIFTTEMKSRIADKTSLMHTRDYYSKATYFRVYIPNMFKKYKKAIYLDCDIALNGDISELYNVNLGNNYVGAITCETVDTHPVYTAYVEKYVGMKLPHYFNAGILVLNTEMLRRINFEDRFFDLMTKVRFDVIQDQDYLNVLFEGHVKFLPIIWNKTPYPGNALKLEDVKLVHYNLTYRPWRYDGVLYADLFWKHAKNTLVYEKLIKMKKDFSQADIDIDNNMMSNLVKLAEEQSKVTESFKDKVANGKIVLMK